MQRYDIWVHYDELQENQDNEGSWVRYDDAQAEIVRLNAEVLTMFELGKGIGRQGAIEEVAEWIRKNVHKDMTPNQIAAVMCDRLIDRKQENQNVQKT